MKLLTSLFCTAFLAAAFALPARADDYQAPVRQAYSLGAAGHVNVEAGRDGVSGTITVMAWDRNTVEVSVTTAPADASKIRATVTRTGNDVSIVVFSTEPRRFFGLIGPASVDATIHVRAPVASVLRLSTVNGEVTVTNVSGEIHASSVNGNMTLQHTGAVLSLTTVNGSVNAGVAEVSASPSIRISTVNGNVDVSVPAGFSTRVRTGTVNGDVTNPFQNATGAGKVSIETVNGAIAVRKR